MRLRLRSKLLLGVLIYELLLGAVGAAGIYSAQVTLDSVHTLVNHHIRETSLLGELAGDVNLLQSDLLLHTLGRSPEEEGPYEQQVVQVEQRVDAWLDELLGIQFQFGDETDIERLQAFRGAWDQFVTVTHDQYLPLSRQGRDGEVFELAQPSGSLGQAFDEVRTQLTLLQALLPSESTERVQEAEEDFAWHRNGLIVTLILAGLGGIALGLGQVTRLARAIEALSQGASRVAQGNFGQRVRVETGDELERLAGSFNVMTNELQRMSDEQLAVERMKNDFISMVSHELRTPMNGVIGMTSLLLRGSLGQQEREYAEAAQRSGEALLAIINDILDVSKIEAGRLELESGPVDIAATVEDVVVLLAPQAQAKGLKIACLVDADVPRAVVGDGNRLRQILLNLVGNAVKFTDTGEVIVRARTVGPESEGILVRFEVADTGIGIGHDVRDGLFRTFSQVDASMRRRAGGTGLGLAISKRLAELMGGTVGFESETGRGSTFWATVRFKRAEQWAAAPPPPAVLRGSRVLVVDHNVATGSILVERLATLGMIAELAADGPAAISRLTAASRESAPFAVALVDRALPDVDGVALANQVATDARLADTRVVLLNRLGENLQGQVGAGSSVSAALEKPVRQQRLVETLTRVLGGLVSESVGQEAEVRQDVALLPSGAGDVPRVLLVEDVAINRQVASAMLRNLGMEVDAAVNGREALDILDMHLDDAPYAAILMDCQMPQLDGFETTAAIRAREAGQRRMPIIAMTAGAMRGDRDRCLAAGMDDYLAKPLRFEALEQALQRWLGPFAVPSGGPSQPAVPVQASPATIDWAVLADLGRQLDWAGGSDGSALAGMIAEFRVEAASRIDALCQAAKANDTPGVRKAAHALRGPAGSLGAHEVESLAAQLERLTCESSLEGAEALIDAVRSAVERASVALEQWPAMPALEARCAS